MKTDALPALPFGALRRLGGRRVNIYWEYWDRRDHKKKRKSTGTNNPKEAARIASAWASDFVKDLDSPPMPDNTDGITFGQAVEAYLTEAATRLEARSYDTVVDHLTGWGGALESIGIDTPIENVRPMHIAALQAQLRERGVMPQTVNKVTGTINQVFDWALYNDFIQHKPQWRNLSVQRKEHKRELSDYEIRRVLIAARRRQSDPQRKHIWLVVWLAIGAGLRRSEILSLRWEDIDWENGFIYLERQKNRTAAPAPMLPALIDHLAPHRQDAGPVISYQDGRAVNDVKTAWRKLIRDARVDQSIGLHHFRHTFACRMFREHGYDARFWTRHTSAEALARYLHVQQRMLLSRKTG